MHAHAAEWRQQGAIEAARDDHSFVTASDAENKIVEESQRAGIPAFQFDPDASPAAKAAQAGAVRATLSRRMLGLKRGQASGS